MLFKSTTLCSPLSQGGEQDGDNRSVIKDPILADLQERVQDWKGHRLSTLGRLHLRDCLSVHRGDLTRIYTVYLLDKAILCVIEKKSDSMPGTLELKGRIFTCHIKDVVDDNERDSSLIVVVKDGEVKDDAFTLGFRTTKLRDVWKAKIRSLASTQW